MNAKHYRFKHVFIDLKKEQRWENIAPMTTSSDGGLIKVNSKYIGFSYKNPGGMLCLLKKEKMGKMPTQFPAIQGHHGPILDLDFVPFHENKVATCSEDTTIQLWEIPEGFTQDITQSFSTLSAHTRKVNLIQFSEATEGVLASTSYDYTVKVWDVNAGKTQYSVTGGTDYCYGLEWSPSGNQLLTTWKDKHTRVIDPRTEKVVIDFSPHQGTRCHQPAWQGVGGNEEIVVSVGFNKTMERELKVFDLRNLSAPIQAEKIMGGSGVVLPFMDSDLGILYLCAKGQSTLRYYEYAEGKFNWYQSDYRGSTSGKGYGFYPKYALDVKQNQIGRVVKLGETFAEMISITYPKQSEGFQEDLFPLSVADYGQSANDWFSGQNAPAQRASLKNDILSLILDKSGKGDLSKLLVKDTPVVSAPQSSVPAPVPAPVVVSAPATAPAPAPTTTSPNQSSAPVQQPTKLVDPPTQSTETEHKKVTFDWGQKPASSPQPLKKEDHKQEIREKKQESSVPSHPNTTNSKSETSTTTATNDEVLKLKKEIDILKRDMADLKNSFKTHQNSNETHINSLVDEIKYRVNVVEDFKNESIERFDKIERDVDGLAKREEQHESKSSGFEQQLLSQVEELTKLVQTMTTVQSQSNTLPAVESKSSDEKISVNFDSNVAGQIRSEVDQLINLIKQFDNKN